MGKSSSFTAQRTSCSVAKQHGTDQGQAPAVQLGDRGEAANAALPPEVHVKGLDSIIEVVAKRHFIAAQLLRRRVQRAPA